ncbi:MAG: PIG-L family deacetylase [Thermoanaerobaculia bacterium]
MTPPRSHLLPPGETSRIDARRVLVVAPHHDDEVLGCGGLLAQLAAPGARIRVLFLTDGAAGAGSPGEADDALAYTARRRAESARALEALGVAEADAGEHLDLPDGNLAGHADRAAEAIRRALVDLEPDLLLAPSPLEVTADHRAAFAAVHRVLHPLRQTPGDGSDDPLPRIARDLDVLLYEVNHPGYPDVLVDVSREVPRIEAAMACYASQQEVHDYLAAGLGLRSFRTLSLPRHREAAPSGGPSSRGAEPVRAAEGYRRLSTEDFATRGPAELVRWLGGVPELLEVREGPPVSVIVRTRDRPSLLAEALESLAAGTYRRVEVVLVNDGGAPPEPPADYPLALRRVDLPENRGRASAANAGLAAASGAYVAFLDDDDLAGPEHLASLAASAAEARLPAVYSDAAVVTYALDGGAPGEPAGWREVERRLPYSRDFDLDLLLLDNYIPFNTLLVERELLLGLAPDRDSAGPFDPDLPFFEDWDLLIRLGARHPLHHLRRVTCEYRHFRGASHHALGGSPRERADFLEVKARVLAKHAGLLGPDRLARAVDSLRAEAVELAEEASAARSEVSGARRERSRVEDRYHRLHGEVAALRDDRALRLDELERSAGEVRRLQKRERELVAAVQEQTDHIGRTYAEIERLNGLLRELRGSSLPGLVRWWRRNRGGPEGEG